MPKIPDRRATRQDIFDLPDNVVGEIIDGELFVSPRPSPRHSHALSSLGARLISAVGKGGAGGNGGWVFLIEPDVELGEHTVVPDVAGWRRERLPHPPEGNAIQVAPDWAGEVLSPGTARLDRVKKMPLYASYSVHHFWLVDPVLRLVEIFRLENGHWQLVGAFSDRDQVRVEPFGDVVFDLADLWWE